jgi:hypothetical protein
MAQVIESSLGISKAKHLPARDVASLVRLRLVDENEGRVKLTDLGRERYQGRHLLPASEH